MGLLDALKDKQFRDDVATNALNLGRAASNAVTSNVSGPVDLISWALRKAGVPVGDAPAGSSNWFKNQGLMSDVPHSPASTVGETLGLLAPIAMTAGAPRIANGLLKVIDNAQAPKALNNQAGVVRIGDKFVYPQEQALATAQKNAALPVSEGGLGLPPNNTAMDRAKALGFDTDAKYIHGTNKIPDKITNEGRFPGIFTLKNAESGYGSANMPLHINGKVAHTNDLLNYHQKHAKSAGISGRGQKNRYLNAINEKVDYSKDYADIADDFVRMQADRMNIAKSQGFHAVNMTDEFGQEAVAILPTGNARSSFAAFDPKRANENDLLAGALPFSALVDEENRNYLRGLLSP